MLTSFGRRLLVLVPVYPAGAMGLSVGFVLFGPRPLSGWRRVREEKERSLRVCAAAAGRRTVYGENSLHEPSRATCLGERPPSILSAE